jgi:membrane fusion protein (multidrug efflux system)
MHVARTTIGLTAAALAFGTIALGASTSAEAQPAPTAPPAVGVIEAIKRPITESSEFLGRVEAINRVNIVARVTAFLDKRLFQEGADVKKGDHLYLLERGPFEADLAAKKAQVAQLQATLTNNKLTTDRQRSLMGGPAFQQSNLDSAVANQLSFEAQVQGAQALVDSSQINLDYTDIRSPIDGKIGRTAVTEGNVVSSGSGTLTTVVSQDPMYVTFPVSVRESLDLRDRYVKIGGFKAVNIRIKLPNGKMYDKVGQLDFVNNTIASSTDTILVRGTIANPPIFTTADAGGSVVRELSDNEFVTVMLEGVEPVEVLAIPRAAVLSDQQGEYVFTVGADNKAEQHRVQLGQSTSTIAAVMSGISLGDKVIVEGLQRVRPGQPVAPGPASALIQSSMKVAPENGDRPPSSGATAAKPAGTTP